MGNDQWAAVKLRWVLQRASRAVQAEYLRRMAELQAEEKCRQPQPPAKRTGQWE